MSTTITFRLPDEITRELDEVSAETERSRSFHILKAIDAYLREYADVQIALDRLRDTTDPVISSDEMREELDI